jgi:hypothetical protein
LQDPTSAADQRSHWRFGDSVAAVPPVHVATQRGREGRFHAARPRGVQRGSSPAVAHRGGLAARWWLRCLASHRGGISRGSRARHCSGRGSPRRSWPTPCRAPCLAAGRKKDSWPPESGCHAADCAGAPPWAPKGPPEERGAPDGAPPPPPLKPQVESPVMPSPSPAAPVWPKTSNWREVSLRGTLLPTSRASGTGGGGATGGRSEVRRRSARSRSSGAISRPSRVRSVPG